MSIKEKIEHDKKRTFAYEDLGIGLIQEDTDTLPTEKYALVFSLVILKEDGN